MKTIKFKNIFACFWSPLLVLLIITTFPMTRDADAEEKIANLRLPAGFKVSIFANSETKYGSNLSGARFMAFDANGNLFVSLSKQNKVVMLIDQNKDGIAEDVITVAENLNAPQGLSFLGNSLFIANQDGVAKFEKDQDRWREVNGAFINNLPAGGHALKTIKWGPDGYLYINVGSSCNVCMETDPLRATILRYTADGKPAGSIKTLGRHLPSPIWASGLRNTQDFAWNPQSGDMFATNDGADMRSISKGGMENEEVPPEHLNKIEAGKNYGWPFCWGQHIEDPNFSAGSDYCLSTAAPEVTFTSHSTPIGITFLDKTDWPSEFKEDAIVALHGSWNRKHPSGYKLVRIKFKNGQVTTVEDFATGWLNANEAWGRPVDVIVGLDHALYISDDKAGVIYRVTYQAEIDKLNGSKLTLP